LPECASKDLVTCEPVRPRNLRQRSFTDHERGSRALQPQPSRVFLRRLAERLPERAMQMKRRPPRTLRQARERDIAIDATANIPE